MPVSHIWNKISLPRFLALINMAPSARFRAAFLPKSVGAVKPSPELLLRVGNAQTGVTHICHYPMVSAKKYCSALCFKRQQKPDVVNRLKPILFLARQLPHFRLAALIAVPKRLRMVLLVSSLPVLRLFAALASS